MYRKGNILTEEVTFCSISDSISVSGQKKIKTVATYDYKYSFEKKNHIIKGASLHTKFHFGCG